MLIVDDVYAALTGVAFHGWTPEEVAPRFIEDLAWLGCPADRVVFASENAAQHDRPERELGLRRPRPFGPVKIRWRNTPITATWRDWADADGAEEGWLLAGTYAIYNDWAVATVALDDVAFGVTGWWCGLDWVWNSGLYDSLGQRLGLNLPDQNWHPMVRHAREHAKVSKSNTRTCTLRMLREAGYSGAEVIETLQECDRRSYRDGLECVVIPEGILCPERHGVLEHQQLAVLKAASDEGAFPDHECNDSARRTARKWLAERVKGSG